VENLQAETKSSDISLIETLSQDPRLQKLFAADAGVWEGFSIREHTAMVLKIFNEQFSRYESFYRFQVSPEIRLLETLKFAIALHDIGKPYAIGAGDKSRQHEFTIPILESKMQEFGFSPAEIHFAKALVGHDILGDYIKGKIDASMAKVKLSKVADELGMPLVNFAPLQFLFYTIDASAYPSLRQRIFKVSPEGLLVPNKDQFRILWQLIATPF
jgi:hypothetical protein